MNTGEAIALHPRKSVAVLPRLQAETMGVGDLYASKVLAIRLVEALQIGGDKDQAVSVLAQALRNSAKSGVFRTLLNGGPPVRTLLSTMCGNAEHARSELLLFMSTKVRRVIPDTGSHQSLPMTSLDTPLSSRERSVLQLIGTGLSNKRIARELEISPETVKSHAKHILVKLKAQNRAEAVARATALNFI